MDDSEHDCDSVVIAWADIEEAIKTLEQFAAIWKRRQKQEDT